MNRNGCSTSTIQFWEAPALVDGDIVGLEITTFVAKGRSCFRNVAWVMDAPSIRVKNRFLNMGELKVWIPLSICGFQSNRLRPITNYPVVRMVGILTLRVLPNDA